MNVVRIYKPQSKIERCSSISSQIFLHAKNSKIHDSSTGCVHLLCTEARAPVFSWDSLSFLGVFKFGLIDNTAGARGPRGDLPIGRLTFSLQKETKTFPPPQVFQGQQVRKHLFSSLGPMSMTTCFLNTMSMTTCFLKTWKHCIGA